MRVSADTFFDSCGVVGLLKIHPPLRIPLTRGTTSRATRFVGTGGRKSRGNATSDSNSFCISRRRFTISLLPSATTFLFWSKETIFLNMPSSVNCHGATGKFLITMFLFVGDIFRSRSRAHSSRFVIIIYAATRKSRRLVVFSMASLCFCG